MTKFIIINECSLKYFACNVCISLLFSILFNHFYGKEIKSTFVQITGQRTIIMMITTTSTTKNSASNSTAACRCCSFNKGSQKLLHRHTQEGRYVGRQVGKQVPTYTHSISLPTSIPISFVFLNLPKLQTRHTLSDVFNVYYFTLQPQVYTKTQYLLTLSLSLSVKY